MKTTMTDSFMSELQTLVIDTYEPWLPGHGDPARGRLIEALEAAQKAGARRGRFTVELEGEQAARLLYELWSWDDIWQEWGFEGLPHLRQAARLRREVLAAFADDPHVLAEEVRRRDFNRRLAHVN